MEPQDALVAWAIDGVPRVAPDAGLINRTFLVGEPARAVLQWVNPIFHPAVQTDIAAITEHLARRGLITPRLLPNRDGGLFLPDDQEGVWRLLSFVPGVTKHRLTSNAEARAAGALVGRFHAALADCDHVCVAPRRNIHDTRARLANLRSALEACDGHSLAEPARALGELILERFSTWEGELDLPERLCHGDLKISNLRFAADGSALCLIDLDTLGPQALACEMGDAWRSWCNPAGEDDPEACIFDLELFAASTRAWMKEVGQLERRERESLVPGIERICLELAARFCTDAVKNIYFRENREKFPEPGAHNLLRARGQLNLAISARAARLACQNIILEMP